MVVAVDCRRLLTQHQDLTSGLVTNRIYKTLRVIDGSMERSVKIEILTHKDMRRKEG